MKKFILPFMLVIFALPALAQYTVKGRVINQKSKQPVSNATIFINNSSIGTTTNAMGQFILTLSPGQYNLLISNIGYQDYKSPLTVKTNILLSDIMLIPATDTIREVTIKAKVKLPPYYNAFITEFFGNSQFADQCKILNPYVLQFYDANARGGFSARSTDYIQIVNNALGYKIKYLLNYFIRDMDKQRCFFKGESEFEDMKGTPEQERKWRRNRLICYQGSSMQMLRAVISDSVTENGFRIKRARHKVNPYYDQFSLMEEDFDDNNLANWGGQNDLIFSGDGPYVNTIENHSLTGRGLLLHTNQQGIYAITSRTAADTADNSYYIEHVKDVVPVINGLPVHVPWIWPGTITFFTFKSPYLLFNQDGKILNAKAISVEGYMPYQVCISTMLPFDYKPME